MTPSGGSSFDQPARIIRGLLYNDDDRTPGEWEDEAAQFLSRATGASNAMTSVIALESAGLVELQVDALGARFNVTLDPDEACALAEALAREIKAVLEA